MADIYGHIYKLHTHVKPMLQLLTELFIHDADIYKYLYSYLLGPHCAIKKACIEIHTRLSLCPHNTWIVVERKGEKACSW